MARRPTRIKIEVENRSGLAEIRSAGEVACPSARLPEGTAEGVSDWLNALDNTGRPSLYDAHLAAQVLEAVSRGEAIADAADRYALRPAILSEWEKRRAQFSTALARAMHSGAHYCVARAEHLLAEARTKTKLGVARELARALQWRAARQYPALYGDVTKLRVSGTIEHSAAGPTAPGWLADRLRPPLVIDATPQATDPAPEAKAETQRDPPVS